MYRGSEFMSTITFIWMVIQLQRTVIPSSLYLNGPPIWFSPQTRKVKPTLYSKIRKVLLSGLQFNDPHSRFVSHTLQNDDFLNWGVSLGICSIICLHPKLQKDCNYRTDILSIWNDAHSIWHETLNLVSGKMCMIFSCALLYHNIKYPSYSSTPHFHLSLDYDLNY